MRVALHWRGKPLVAVDLLAITPEDQHDNGPTLQASGFLADSSRAAPMQPDTTTFGFGDRPES